jgi:hypothetical protein
MGSIATVVRGPAIALPFGLMIAAGPSTAAADPSPNQPPSDPQNVQKLMGLVSKGYGPANCKAIPTEWQGQLAPHTWNYGQNSTDIAGWVTCGTFNGTAEIVWTNNAKGVLGVIEGNDLADLHQWWQTSG